MNNSHTPQNSNPFVEWLRAGVLDGSLSIDQRKSALHRVPEGLLLVSPRIFQTYQADEKAWKKAQKRFLRLRLHHTASAGSNLHRYRVLAGTRRGRECYTKGILIPPDNAFWLCPNLDLSKTNPYLEWAAHAPGAHLRAPRAAMSSLGLEAGTPILSFKTRGARYLLLKLTSLEACDANGGNP